jgi:hypothetical protein
MALKKRSPKRVQAEVEIPFWQEALCGIDLVMLHASPVCYGIGVPRGDNSAVILIPGFLGSDRYLTQLHSWLQHIGYRPYSSGITLNAECPNLLIRHRLSETIDRALDETGRQVHVVGHSLGGIIARSIANQRPKDVASVITLAAAFRGSLHRSIHSVVLRAAKTVRKQILQEHGPQVLPACYTSRCTCDFLTHLRCKIPSSVLETAVYTRNDGVVDWRCCVTGDPDVDCEVSGTHLGLVFNASVYKIIADRLARAHARTQENRHDESFVQIQPAGPASVLSALKRCPESGGKRRFNNACSTLIDKRPV